MPIPIIPCKYHASNKIIYTSHPQLSSTILIAISVYGTALRYNTYHLIPEVNEGLSASLISSLGDFPIRYSNL
jgi:hypothetical protein